MGTTTGSSGMAEPTPKPKRVNKLVEAINRASESEVKVTEPDPADVGLDSHAFLDPVQAARLRKIEQAKDDRRLFRESLRAFIVALEVKHPAHIGAAVALADEYVKVVNMRYPFDIS